jgi:hypothetical protein
VNVRAISREALSQAMLRARGFVATVAAGITWRRFLIAQALGFIMSVLRLLQNGNEMPAGMFVSSTVITSLSAAFVLIAAVVADEALRRGAAARLVCPSALIVAAVVTTVSQWYVRGWLHLYTAVNKPGVAEPVQRTMMIFVALDVISFGGFAMLAFLNRRREQRIMEGVRTSELKRARLERRLAASRLAAARAEVDPQQLAQSVQQIRDAYQAASPAAERELDGLIEELEASVIASAVALDVSVAMRPA